MTKDVLVSISGKHIDIMDDPARGYEVGEDGIEVVTPLTLFMPEGLIKYETESFVGAGVLLAGAAVFLVVGIMRFKKRDLLL